jgi:predicted RNase H-like HicB family nuclease
VTTYAVSLARRYDGLVIATLPDLPEVVAFGRDDEEALEEVSKCLAASLGRRLAAGETPPVPTAKSLLSVAPTPAFPQLFA